jgi:hypothetical protein
MKLIGFRKIADWCLMKAQSTVFWLVMLVLVLLMAVVAGSVNAQEPACSVTTDQAIERFGGYPGAEVVMVTDPTELATLVEFYNLVPPPSADVFDKVVYFTRPGAFKALILYMRDDCVRGTLQVPKPVLRSVLDGDRPTGGGGAGQET